MSSSAQPIPEKPPISERKLAANRANAQKSTGPRSPEGKIAASMNSYRHGLTGNIMVVALEEQPYYFRMAADFIKLYKPVGVEEIQLTQKIVDANWRLNRIAALENNLFNVGLTENLEILAGHLSTHAVAQAKAFREDCAGPNAIDKLGRYEARLLRSMFKLREELKAIQKERPESNPEADAFSLRDSQAYAWYEQVTKHAEDLIEHFKRSDAEETPKPEAEPASNGSPVGSFSNPDILPILIRPVTPAKPFRKRLK